MSAAVLREAAAQVRADCPIPEPSRGLDFIDFPTGWAIQRVGVEHVAECSAVVVTGALLCDCEAIYPAWRRWRSLLAVADWLDAYAERLEVLGHAIGSNHGEALAVAEAYLATPA